MYKNSKQRAETGKNASGPAHQKSELGAFYHSASGNQMANQGVNGHVWNAAGDGATPTINDSTPTSPNTPAPASAPCACPSWHKPGCFVTGLAVGALVAWLLTRSKAA